jgi:hypothetical protein
MEKYTIKLLSMILAFAGYADLAKAELPVVLDKDGVTTWQINSRNTTRDSKSTSAYFYVSTARDVATVIVPDCMAGKGDMTIILNGKYKDFDWHHQDRGVFSSLAIMTCASRYGK